MNKNNEETVINFNNNIGNISINNNEKYLAKLDKHLFKGNNQVYVDLVMYYIKKKFNEDGLIFLTKNNEPLYDYSRLVNLMIEELRLYELLFENFYGNEFLNYSPKVRSNEEVEAAIKKRESGYALSKFMYFSDNKFFRFCSLAVSFRLNELCVPHLFDTSVSLISDFILDSYEETLNLLKQKISSITQEHLQNPVKIILTEMKPETTIKNEQLLGLIAYIFSTNALPNKARLASLEPCRFVTYMEELTNIDISRYHRKTYGYLMDKYGLRKTNIYKRSKMSEEEVLQSFVEYLNWYDESAHVVHLLDTCTIIMQFQDEIKQDVTQHFLKLRRLKEQFDLNLSKRVDMSSTIKAYLNALNDSYSMFSFLKHEQQVERTINQVSRGKELDLETQQKLYYIGANFLRRKDIIENELPNFLLNELPRDFVMKESIQNVIFTFENKYQEAFTLHRKSVTNDDDDLDKKVMNFRRLIRTFEKLGYVNLNKVQLLTKSSPLSNEEQFRFLSKISGFYEKLFDLSRINKTPLCLYEFNSTLKGGVSENNSLISIDSCNYTNVHQNIYEYLNEVSVQSGYNSFVTFMNLDIENIKQTYYEKLHKIYKKSKNVLEFLQQISTKYIWRMDNYNLIKDLMEDEIVEYMYGANIVYNGEANSISGGASEQNQNSVVSNITMNDEIKQLPKEHFKSLLRKELEDGTFKDPSKSKFVLSSSTNIQNINNFVEIMIENLIKLECDYVTYLNLQKMMDVVEGKIKKEKAKSEKKKFNKKGKKRTTQKNTKNILNMVEETIKPFEERVIVSKLPKKDRLSSQIMSLISEAAENKNRFENVPPINTRSFNNVIAEEISNQKENALEEPELHPSGHNLRRRTKSVVPEELKPRPRRTMKSKPSSKIDKKEESTALVGIPQRYNLRSTLQRQLQEQTKQLAKPKRNTKKNTKIQESLAAEEIPQRYNLRSTLQRQLQEQTKQPAKSKRNTKKNVSIVDRLQKALENVTKKKKTHSMKLRNRK